MKRLLIASFLLLVLAALPLSHLLMAKGPAPHKPNQLCHNGHLIHPTAPAGRHTERTATALYLEGSCPRGFLANALPRSRRKLKHLGRCLV